MVNDKNLSEKVRQQYLEAMGIQSWFDPEWVAPPLNDVVIDEVRRVSAETNSEARSLVSPQPQVNEVVTPPPSVPIDSELPELEVLNRQIEQCQLCELHTTRHEAICGEGNKQADLFIIIDSPVDDNKGEGALFSAQNKHMLQAMLSAIGYDLSSVYLSSLVKCRPPEQRRPQISEMICCDDHLSAQINIIQQRAILILGEQASQQLLVSQKTLTDLRLRRHQHLGVPVFASYHPADLFNSAETKRKVWADLLQIKQQITTNH